MLKSLHHLTASVARAIMLVALFAVGMTASAEKYIVTFNQETDTFYDGPLTVITSTNAGADGLTLSSLNNTLRLYFHPDEAALDAQAGIGRIVFSVADEMTETQISNFVSVNKAFVKGGDHKLVYTPTVVGKTLSLNCKANSIFPTVTRMIFTQAEVYTGYCCQTAQERELNPGTHTSSRNTTLETDGNFAYTQVPAEGLGKWSILSPNKGNSDVLELIIPTDTYFNFGQEASALLHLRRGQATYHGKARSLNLGSCDFDVYVPAGYAIKSVRFVGSRIDDIESISHGTMSGDVDRIWTTDEEVPMADHVIFRNTASDEVGAAIERIIIAYSPIPSTVDTRFDIDALAVWPFVDQEIDLTSTRTFYVNVPAPDGVTFESSVENSTFRMAVGTTVYDVEVNSMVNPTENTVTFAITLPDAIDVTRPFEGYLSFPQGAIRSTDGYCREFMRMFRFGDGCFTLQVSGGNMLYGNLTAGEDYSVINLKDQIYQIFFPQGVVDELYFGFDAEGTIDWTRGNEIGGDIVLRNDVTNEVIPLLDATILEGRALSVKPLKPLEADVNAHYSLTLKRGVIIDGAGHRNDDLKLGFILVNGVSKDDVRVTPIEGARISELSEIRVTSNIGGTFALLTNRAEFLLIDDDGSTTSIGADVRLENNAVVYTLETSITSNGYVLPINIRSYDLVYTLQGKVGGVPETYHYTLDPNIQTVRYFRTEPVENAIVSRENIRNGFQLYDGECTGGFFVAFDRPITNAAGVPLSHGEQLWAITAPTGYSFACVAEYNTIDFSQWNWTDVRVYNRDDEYGLFIPTYDLFTGDYVLHIEQGSFYLGSAVNQTIDLTWTLVDTEPDGALTIVNPRYQQTLQYVDKLVVAPNVRYADTKIVSVTERVKFAVSEIVRESQRFTNREVWATGTLENGQAVYTFDEPLTCDVEAGMDIMLPIGILKTEYGNANPFMTIWVDINPNLQYVEVDYTLPNAEEITTYDKLAKELNNFQVIYSASAGTIDYNAEDKFYHNGTPIGYSLYNPNNVGYSGISITHVESGEQISNIDVYVPSDWGWDRTVAFHSNQDLRPGHYRVQCPVGAIRFENGSVNAPIDITWTLINSFNAGQVLLADPSPNFQVPFRKMRLAPIPDATTVTEFKFADLDKAPASIQYAYQTATDGFTSGRVGAKLSTDADGYLNIEFERTIEYPGEVNITIPSGIFYDTAGRVNPQLDYNFYIDYYQLGEPEGMPDIVTSFSDIHVPILNDVTVESVPETYTITFRAFRNDAATGERKLISEWKNRAGFVSLSHDDGGKPELLVSFPIDLIRNCYDNPDERTTIEVELPGQAYSYDNTNVIPNKEGVPNQALTFEFTVWPNATYSCYFSVIDMPEGVTIRYNGDALNVTPNGFNLESAAPITADGFSFEGLPEGCECDIAIEGDGLNYDGRLDFTRYAKVIAYPFEDNTVAQDEVTPNTNIGFTFDRDVDENSVDANYLLNSIALYDGNGEPVSLAWANAATRWMGFGLSPDYTLYPGTYTFFASAHLFRFTDGSWNPEILYTFTVTEATHYAFADARIQQIDNSGLVTEVSSLAGRVNPFYRFILYPELSERTYFQGYRKYVEADVSRNGEYLGKKTLMVSHYFTGDDERRPMFFCDFVKEAITEGTIEYVTLSEPGDYIITIPADAIVKDGLGNREYTLYAKVTDPDARTLNVFVDGSNAPVSDFPIEIATIGSSAPGVIGLSGEDVHFNHNQQEPRIPGELSYYYVIDGFYLIDGVLSVNVRKKLSLGLTDGKVDGKGGLHSATVEFDYALVPGLFRSRIDWSEGFKLQRRSLFTYSNVANDIAYVNTSVENNELTLHFFNAEGRELFPMDKFPNYRLTVPFNAIFAYGNLINGYIQGLPYDSSTGLLTLTFEVTEPQVVTDDPDYDAEHETVAEQANTFADILLGSRRSGSRTNDLNGDGSLTIGDLVQFIEQNKPQTDPELEIPADETVIWSGRQPLSTSNGIYIGEDGGQEFRDNNVKPGTKARFYFNCSDTEVGNYLIIHEGHWGPQYVSLNDFDKAQGYVTLTLTQEMIDAALTQQYWGGIFVLMGSECFTLTKVTLYNESSGTVDPSNLPDEPIFDPAYDPAEGEEILWVGSHNLSWESSDYLLVGSDGGTELQQLGAKVGSEIRIYGEKLDSYCIVQVQEGHWAKMYGHFSVAPEESMPACGYFAFTLTQEMLDQLYTAQNWGSAFLIHGENFRVTKVALVPDYDPNTDPNVGIHPTLPGDDSDPVL